MIEEEEQDLDPRTPEVFDKYRTSGDITSRKFSQPISCLFTVFGLRSSYIPPFYPSETVSTVFRSQI